MTGARAAFKAAGKPMPPIRYRCVNRIPYARGMGSSSAAIVAGLIGGLVLAGHQLSMWGHEELLQLACSIEVGPGGRRFLLLKSVVFVPGGFHHLNNDNTVAREGFELARPRPRVSLRALTGLPWSPCSSSSESRLDLDVPCKYRGTWSPLDEDGRRCPGGSPFSLFMAFFFLFIFFSFFILFSSFPFFLFFSLSSFLSHRG